MFGQRFSLPGRSTPLLCLVQLNLIFGTQVPFNGDFVAWSKILLDNIQWISRRQAQMFGGLTVT